MTEATAPPDALVRRWLPYGPLDSAGAAATALYCLPHAGGGASAYRSWVSGIPGVSVRPMQLPGRESRLRDTAIDRMDDLAAQLADVVIADQLRAGTGQGYAVYGHSLGALVAFELVRELRRRRHAMPRHLFVSGAVAPHRPFDDGPQVTGMPREEVVALLRALGGTPEWLLADPSAVEMILPAVRADFSVKETYAYDDDEPLDVAMTVLSSTDDPRASQDLQAAWRDLTSGPFSLHTLVGGHFAVFEQSQLTHGHIVTALHE